MLRDEIANEMVMEECRASWRAEARAWARKAAVDAGLDPSDSSESVKAFMAQRETERYAMLESIGMENIR